MFKAVSFPILILLIHFGQLFPAFLPLTASSIKGNTDTITEVKPDRIVWLETEIDFGEAREGRAIDGTFIFRNEGPSAVRIERVIGACGCLIPSFSRRDIQVGEMDSLQIRFLTKGRRGYQQKHIRIHGNFVGQRQLLSLKGFVIGKDK